jgi:predicted ATPase
VEGVEVVLMVMLGKMATQDHLNVNLLNNNMAKRCNKKIEI